MGDVEETQDGVRAAWLGVLRAYVRAAESHAETAARHARAGQGRFAEEAWRLAAGQRDGFERVLAIHPEWAEDAPSWPEAMLGASRSASARSG